MYCVNDNDNLYVSSLTCNWEKSNGVPQNLQNRLFEGAMAIQKNVLGGRWDREEGEYELYKSNIQGGGYTTPYIFVLTLDVMLWNLIGIQ